MYHTRAKTIFMPSTCDGYGSTFGHTSGRLIAARSWRDESFEVGLNIREPVLPLIPFFVCGLVFRTWAWINLRSIDY